MWWFKRLHCTKLSHFVHLASSIKLTSCPTRICAVKPNSVPFRLLTVVLTFSCLINHLQQRTTLCTDLVLYSQNVLSLMVWQREHCRECCTSLSSLCLPLSSQCSTAVPLCTCPDRLGESHSKFELTVNTLHHRHILVLLHHQQKSLLRWLRVNCLMTFWKLILLLMGALLQL